jgi:Undecaprenyl-phosphate glucose phosphotransferase
MTPSQDAPPRRLGAAATSAVLPSHAIPAIPPALGRLSIAITRLAVLEFLAVAASAYVASAIYQHVAVLRWPPAEIYVTASLFLAAMVMLVSLALGHFSEVQAQPRQTFLWNGFAAVALAFSFLITAMFVLKVTDPYSRATFLFQFITVAIAVLTGRAFAYSRLQGAIAAGLVEARRVILIGEPQHCLRFTNRLKATGIRSVASYPFPCTARADDGAAGGLAERELRKLIGACRGLRPDDILLLADRDNLARTTALVGSLSELPAGLHIVLVESAEILAAGRIVEFGDLVTLQVSRPPLSIFDRAAKRAFDLVVAAAGLILLSPLLLIVSLAIKLDSRGPVLFRQTRHGYNNETIQVFKFRSMTTMENGADFVQASRNDTRVTRIGRLLRRSNIDELPQLINVLRGEMSIVGPRPHATAHNDMFEQRISPFSRRHVVKPGITGWAQVNGYRGETDTLEKMQRRIEYDLHYIDNWSFLFDLRIIIMTFFSRTAYTNAY